MNIPDSDLITEAVRVNHKQIKKKGAEEYETNLIHFASYLHSVCGENFYSAQRRHVLMFMHHLEDAGGKDADRSRLDCEWCNRRGCPTGRKGKTYAASTRKKALAAIRFLYAHFAEEDRLPSIDPSARISYPKIVNEPGFIPSAAEVRRMLDAEGSPRETLLAWWVTHEPERRSAFAKARWKDFDLDGGMWWVNGKGDKSNVLPLNRVFLNKLKRYREWQAEQAAGNPKIVAALLDEDTAYVLLTRTGRPLNPHEILKMLKRRALRAGVAIIDSEAKDGTQGGKTSKVTCHSFRRGWATHALNHPTDPVPIDVVSQALNHSSIDTTRRHYAQTKPERVKKAIEDMTWG